MVGRGGVEPPTSRLSGVRSNHLSYRPILAPQLTIKAAGGKRPAQAGRTAFSHAALFQKMKGHEDDGYVL